MAWRRHTRQITKETFYDGTTIDGSRLDKAMGEIVDHVNDVPKGDVQKRFVAVQYHAGFQPQDRATAAYHRFPWLSVLNTDVVGDAPQSAPYNILRLKGSSVAGIYHNAGGAAAAVGSQYAWTRVFHFSRPVVVNALNVLMRLDGGATTATNPYVGTHNPGAVSPYTTGIHTRPPVFVSGTPSADVVVVLDVCNPASPEDAELNDVELTRHRWVVNEEPFTLIPASTTPAAAPTWNDFNPPFDAIGPGGTDNRPINGRLLELSDLNIPIHQNARVRLSIVIPKYDGTVSGVGSWGAIPWYLQAWDATLTVLEEVQAL
jgi:hypothetical protein